ncbi:hypothetical protein HOI18_02240 [Candidatus Uhrbacteria bacterium]|jgi:hypothetical protein|nr:hypothetical protein [Candidatus Uhrbacteria bacterium]
MNDQFKRILDLVRRTGDTMVVTDPDGDEAYVVMNLDQYELMLDVEHDLGEMVMGDDVECFEEDLMGYEVQEEVNIPDVAENSPQIKAETKGIGIVSESGVPSESPADIWSAMKPAGEEGETWDPEQLNPDQLADLEQQYQVFAARNVQEAIDEVEAAAPQKTVSKPTDDDEFGEEQFYLEPIE